MANPIRYCIDPVAQAIIDECLEYCIKNSGVQLKGVENTKVLEDLRDQIARIPLCKPREPAPQEIVVEEKAPPKPRTLPEVWKGPITYREKNYPSPGELARELGINIKGARNMVVAFERAGFKVTTGDGEPSKDKPFIVTRLSPTPAQYLLEKKEISAGTEAEIQEGLKRAESKRRLIPIKMRKEGSTKIEQVAWGEIGPNEQQTQTLTLEDGLKLLATGEAQLG